MQAIASATFFSIPAVPEDALYADLPQYVLPYGRDPDIETALHESNAVDDRVCGLNHQPLPVGAEVRGTFRPHQVHQPQPVLEARTEFPPTGVLRDSQPRRQAERTE